MVSLYVLARNAMHPGYSGCSKCGGNWGWKKEATHKTKADGSRGIFLFCVQCDKTVTLQERWNALDKWKAECIQRIGAYSKTDSPSRILAYARDILNTEYIEFPRGQH